MSQSKTQASKARSKIRALKGCEARRSRRGRKSWRVDTESAVGLTDVTVVGGRGRCCCRSPLKSSRCRMSQALQVGNRRSLCRRVQFIENKQLTKHKPLAIWIRILRFYLTALGLGVIMLSLLRLSDRGDHMLGERLESLTRLARGFGGVSTWAGLQIRFCSVNFEFAHPITPKSNQ